METLQSEIEFLNDEVQRSKEAVKRTLCELKSTVVQGSNPLRWAAEYRWTTALGAVTFLSLGVGTYWLKRRRRPISRRIRAGALDHQTNDRKWVTSILGTLGGIAATTLQTAIKSAAASAVSSQTTPPSQRTSSGY